MFSVGSNDDDDDLSFSLDNSSVEQRKRAGTGKQTYKMLSFDDVISIYLLDVNRKNYESILNDIQ